MPTEKLSMMQKRDLLKQEVDRLGAAHGIDLNIVYWPIGELVDVQTELDRKGLMGQPVRYCRIRNLSASTSDTEPQTGGANTNWQNANIKTTHRFRVKLLFQWDVAESYDASSQKDWDDLTESQTLDDEYELPIGILPFFRQAPTLAPAGSPELTCQCTRPQNETLPNVPQWQNEMDLYCHYLSFELGLTG